MKLLVSGGYYSGTKMLKEYKEKQEDLLLQM